MMTVAEALAQASVLLSQHSPTPRLDAELLLMQAIDKPKSTLYADPSCQLTAAQTSQWQCLLARRQQGEPMAYIRQQQGFWDLELQVTPDVLIPRPETELLVEQALTLLPKTAISIVDLGCGSGAIALSLKKARPEWDVSAVDISAAALAVAKQNAQRLGLSVTWQLGSWFETLTGRRFDAIISNPPYVAALDQHLSQGDVRFEPLQALVAGDDGLAALRVICRNAKNYLNTNGWLLLEHGYNQATCVQALLDDNNFNEIQTVNDIAGHPRVSIARASGLKTR